MHASGAPEVSRTGGVTPGKDDEKPASTPNALRARISGGTPIELPTLTDTSWEMVIRTQAAYELPLDVIRQLSTVHQVQEHVRFLARRMVDVMLDPGNLDTQRVDSTLRKLRVFLGVLVEGESQLVHVYEEALRVLDDFASSS